MFDRRLVLGVLALSLSLASAAHAQAPDVPEVLTPWVPWVLANDSTYGCTLPRAATESDRAIDPICVWPGELRIEVVEGGASFVLVGASDRAFAFALPGSERVQPIDVRLDGRPAVVLEEGGASRVRVEAGEHRIEGRFVWTAPPETLMVPGDVARVLLVEDGVSAVATRGASGEVWLRARETEAVGEDRVTLEVHRRLDDGSPIMLTTRIQVRAAGRARELALGDVLPEGAIPVEVSADLPVRMMAGGELTVQLHAGEFTVTITSLVANPETAYRRPALEAPWPEQEVWVWAPSESYRQVELSGADGIDPARTSLPPEWRSYSAYLVGRESVLTLTTTRRGEPTPPPNELELRRSVWLDVSGAGYTVQDYLTVQMHSLHRLELLDGELGRVNFSGADQLITVGGEGGRPGVELRATTAALTAEWRAEGAPDSLPAVGWSEDAQSSTTTLNLPPGWELIHASGVDRAPGTWVERWTLLGFFALLIITAAVGRVMGWRAGLVAFFGVGLAFHLDEAPRWIWLVLAVLLALHRALDGRRFQDWIRWGYGFSLCIALVIGVVFAADEAKYAFHPQLAPTNSGAAAVGWGSGGEDWGAMEAEAPAATVAAPFDGRFAADAPSEETSVLGMLTRGAASGYGSNSVWLDPSAVVQTGFGVPTWSWSSYSLAFEGPVARDHHIGLYLSPPWLTRLFSFLRAVLTLALLGFALMLRPKTKDASDSASPPAPPAQAGAGAGAAALLAIVAALTAAPARAQEIPSPEILGELHTRLTALPTCERCADANHLAVHIEGDTLIVEMEISAAATASYPLPGPSGTWAPARVTLDGRDTNAVVRLPSGFLHVRVPEGVHLVRVEGPLTGRDAITLAFGRAPRTLSVEAEGWEVDGLSAETSAPESIQLRRALASEPGTTDATLRSDLPTWLEVERRLDIGVRWTITSVVRRRSPATSPAVARIPLLPGESVTDSTVTVEDGLALVTLGQNATEVRWTSTLEPAETVALMAPSEGRVSEVWVLACSALWHCETTGISPTASASGTSWEPRFHPWPGESLTLTMSRPGAAEGQSVTIDRASLTVRPGVRLTSATLDFGVRSSVSAPIRLTVPTDTDVRSLTVDGMTRPLQREGDDVVIALQPGSHGIVLEWQEARGWETAYATPVVTLDHQLVNAELFIEPSPDRWVLWIAGGSWGPAVLFWPYFALALVLAYALSWRKSLPLRVIDWVLLLIGLTQIHPVGALLVIGWFFALEHRKDTAIESAAAFDLRQLVIVGYTALAFGLILWAVQAGLLGDPQMGIEGPGSWEQHLRFFVDRSDGALPTATLISVPLAVFRVLMFVWALWLAASLLKWARWGWGCFKEDGLYRAMFQSQGAPTQSSEATAEPQSSEPQASETTAEPQASETTAEPQASETTAEPETSEEPENKT